MNQPAHIDAPSQDMEFRELPHNLEVEQALLGAILVNNAAMDKVGFLKPEHFHEEVHGRIYDACASMIEKGQTADPVRLKNYFDADEGLKDVGGASYLVHLAASAATIINAREYGQDIYDLWRRRGLIALSEELRATAHDHGCDVDELITQAESVLDEFIPDTVDSAPICFSDTVDRALSAMRAAHEDGSRAGVSSGLTDLDRKIGGFVAGDYIVLAGRPSMGKSALALSFAKVCAKDGKEVHLFNLESSDERIGMRALSMLAADMDFEVHYADAWQGRMDMTDRGTMQQVGELNRSLPIFIHDVSQLSPSQLKSRLRRASRRGEIGLVIVDYLQIMSPPQRQNYQSNRVGDITELSRSLKSIAKQFKVPLIALSQLSRNVEQRDDKRPLLSDLRDSGAIEQDADMVLMVYRHAYYLEKQRPRNGTPEYEAWEVEMTECQNVMEILIGKQRDGPSGIGVKIYARMQNNSFRDLSHG